MNVRRRLTIRSEIFLTALLFLIGISVAFTGMQSVAIQRLSMESVRQRLRNANQQIAAETKSSLDELALMVKLMTQSPDVVDAVTGGEAARQRALLLFAFVENANPNVHYCYAGYESGELLINNYEPPEGYDPTARPWYEAAVRSYPELSIGLPYQEIKDDEWLISVSQAFRADGAIRGVVAVDSTLAGMSDTMNRVNAFDSQINFVVDGHGVILVHENLDYIGMTLESVASGTTELFTDHSDLVSFTTDHGEEIAYYTRLDTADWILVSAIQRSEVIGPIHLRILLVVVGVVVVSVLMGFMQVMLYERRFVRPLVALRKRVFEITSGQLSPRAIEPFSNLELASIAEQIEAMTEGAQTKRAAELRLILESTSDGIIVLDEDSQVIHYNTRFLDLWGLEHEREIHEMDDEMRRRMTESVEPESADRAMRRDHDSDEITSDLIFLTNGMVLEQYSCPIVEDEKVSGRLWSYSDVTARRVAEEKLRRLATTDDLTGLCNRRCFVDRAAYEIEQAARYKRPLSLAQIDVDHFKRINDTYGHAAGDDSLRFLATSLSALLRATDTVARSGGDEFVLMLPGTTAEAAYSVAEKARVFFEQNPVINGESEWTLTISIGVTCSPDAESDLDELLRRADQACYAAKEAGRNRSVAWSAEIGKDRSPDDPE